MYNWDYDLTTGKGDEFTRWKLERMIQYGLGPKDRLPVKQLKHFWEQLRMEPYRRRFLEMLLWKKQSS